MRSAAFAFLALGAMTLTQAQAPLTSTHKPAYASGPVLSAGFGIPVELKTPLKLRDLYRKGKGATFTVEVLDSGVPFRSGIGGGSRLPKGWKIRGTILDVARERVGASVEYKAALVFDQLILPSGATQPFLGGMAETDPGGLPNWAHERKADAESHAASMESLAVAGIWAADMGSAAILLGSFLTRAYQQERKRMIMIRDAKALALTILDDDLPASKFYVVPTLNIEVKR